MRVIPERFANAPSHLANTGAYFAFGVAYFLFALMLLFLIADRSSQTPAFGNAQPSARHRDTSRGFLKAGDRDSGLHADYSTPFGVPARRHDEALRWFTENANASSSVTPTRT